MPTYDFDYRVIKTDERLKDGYERYFIAGVIYDNTGKPMEHQYLNSSELHSGSAREVVEWKLSLLDKAFAKPTLHFG